MARKTENVPQSEDKQPDGAGAATVVTAADLGPDEGDGADSGEKPAALENMDELAARFRVPQWQQAALVRFMGWAPGKRVSAQEYEAALDALLSRRMGGGRKE